MDTGVCVGLGATSHPLCQERAALSSGFRGLESTDSRGTPAGLAGLHQAESPGAVIPSLPALLPCLLPPRPQFEEPAVAGPGGRGG